MVECNHWSNFIFFISDLGDRGSYNNYNRGGYNQGGGNRGSYNNYQNRRGGGGGGGGYQNTAPGRLVKIMFNHSQ